MADSLKKYSADNSWCMLTPPIRTLRPTAPPVNVFDTDTDYNCWMHTDCNSLSFIHNLRCFWPPTPVQQEYYEDTAVLSVNSHVHFLHFLIISTFHDDETCLADHGWVVPLTRHITGHVGDESFQAITCTGTDNTKTTHTTQNKYIYFKRHKKTQKTQKPQVFRLV